MHIIIITFDALLTNPLRQLCYSNQRIFHCHNQIHESVAQWVASEEADTLNIHYLVIIWDGHQCIFTSSGMA